MTRGFLTKTNADERARVKTCNLKSPFRNRKAAMEIAQQMKRPGRAYRCQYCEQWHIASQKMGERK